MSSRANASHRAALSTRLQILPILVGLAAAAGLASVTGCAGVLEAVRDASQRPSAKITNVRLDGLDLQGIGLSMEVEIHNPLSVPLPLLGLGYRLSTRGSEFLTGQTDISGSVSPGGSRIVPVPLHVSFSGVRSVAEGLRPGMVFPYAAELSLTVEPPVAGRLTLPLRHEGELPLPAVPSLALGSLHWGKLSLDTVSGQLEVALTSENQFPLTLRSLSGSLQLGGSEVGIVGAGSPELSLASGEATVLQVPVSFSPRQLGLAAWRLVTGNAADAGLTGRLELGSPFGSLSLPFHSAGRIPLIAPGS